MWRTGLLLLLGSVAYLQVALALPADAEALKIMSRVRRVIGGDEVEKGDWPWLVHLKGKIPTTTFWGIPLAYTSFYCGASIVDKRWIVTAAHCFKQEGFKYPDRLMVPKYWHAKAGEIEAKHSVLDKAKHFAGVFFGKEDWLLVYLHATKIVLHPRYDASQLWQNDIALIKLEDDLPIDDTDPDVGLVSLPQQGEPTWPMPETDCIMKGWGCASNGGPLEDVAQAVKMPALSDTECRNVYFGLDLTTRICAGHNLQAKGICQGDSGGPLVCRDGDKWVQAGIASFTSAKRPDQVPGVFTRISAYIDWINDVIRSDK